MDKNDWKKCKNWIDLMDCIKRGGRVRLKSSLKNAILNSRPLISLLVYPVSACLSIYLAVSLYICLSVGLSVNHSDFSFSFITSSVSLDLLTTFSFKIWKKSLVYLFLSILHLATHTYTIWHIILYHYYEWYLTVLYCTVLYCTVYIL